MSDRQPVLLRGPHVPWLAYPLVWVNGIVEWSFRSGFRAVEHLPCPVVSVGNLTSGGTGKTPLVQWLAEALAGQGWRPAIALRGHGGQHRTGCAIVSDGQCVRLTARDCGDEARAHASRLPHMPVVIGRDRVAASRMIIEQLGCNLVLLDDGFQYWRLQRDVDVVLVEAGWLRGDRHRRHFSREPLSALRRAHVVLLSKADGLSTDEKRAACELLRAFTTDAVIMGECRLQTVGLYEARPARAPAANNSGDVGVERDKPVTAVAFAGLADNAPFFDGVRRLGVAVAQTAEFADHHQYTPGDIERLNRLGADCGAQALITTEKDAAKLDAGRFARPLLTLRVAARVTPAAEILDCLRQRLARAQQTS